MEGGNLYQFINQIKRSGIPFQESAIAYVCCEVWIFDLDIFFKINELFFKDTKSTQLYS